MPIYTHFEGGARAEKRDFLVEILQKVPKNAIFGLFFKILPAAQKFLPKQGLYSGLRELRKSVWSTKIKKGRRQNFSNFFLKIRPPSRNS